MATAKRLAELNGGALSYLPREDGGSVFRFELPRAFATPNCQNVESEMRSKALPGHATALQIGAGLVVDDELSSARAVSRYLSDCCREVFVAGNTAEAIEIIRNNKIDILVSDLNIGAESGLSLIQTVSRQWPEVQHILMSGAHLELDLIEPDLPKSVTFITKPITRERLEQAISGR